MKWFRSLSLVALLSLGDVALSRAQEEEGAAESRATSFQAVEGAQTEQVPGGPLLVGAYGFVLFALVAYVARLGLMQRKSAAEFERLAQAIEAKRKA
jgi:hypothetical protein